MPKNLTHPEPSSLTQFVHYGQPSSPPQTQVNSTDRKSKPFVLPVHSDWNISIPAAQMEKLLLGFKPRQMEDKWFVYAEGDENGVGGEVKVYFVRSWTGCRIAELEIAVELSEGEEKGDGRVKGLVWESSEGVVRGQDELGAQESVRAVCRWLLGVELGGEQ